MSEQPAPSTPTPASEVHPVWEELEADGPQVGIVIATEADREQMASACDELLERAITFEVRVLSAHQNPREVAEYASTAALRGIRVVIAAAGGAAALPGVIASYTELPVIGVPVERGNLGRHGCAAVGGADAGRSPCCLHGHQRRAECRHLRRQDPGPGWSVATASRPLDGDGVGMEQRVSLITLGVADLARARRFYEAMGWHSDTDPELDVVFFQCNCMVLALWDRAQLAEDSGVEDGGGWGGCTPAQNVGSPEQVDEVIEQARAAGATIARPGAATFWGGYSGVFIDPDGHPGRSRTTRTGRSARTAR